MFRVLFVGGDLLALGLLIFALYFPRYRRKDMVVAIIGLNIGVMAVANALASAEVSAGLGLGLFGVLSILRLRSSELAQEEVAYYFSALALGLLAGFEVEPLWVTPALMGLIVLALFVGDHPRLFANNRQQLVNLDRAVTDEQVLVDWLEKMFRAKVLKIKVIRVDLVNDTTTVDVRYRRRVAALAATVEPGSIRPGGYEHQLPSPGQQGPGRVHPTTVQGDEVAGPILSSQENEPTLQAVAQRDQGSAQPISSLPEHESAQQVTVQRQRELARRAAAQRRRELAQRSDAQGVSASSQRNGVGYPAPTGSR